MNDTQTVVTPKVKTKGKSKTVEGDLFLITANEVENLTKAKALAMADELAKDVDDNYFRLGGILKAINENQWYEGYADFVEFVYEKYGFQKRKAFYLIQIYTDLVEKAIPWNKVSQLKWTQLRALSGVLTVDNVDEWVAKAMALSVAQLVALLKGNKEEGGEDETTDEVTVLKFKLHADQAATVKSALNKGKAAAKTDFDTVALELICTAYLADAIATPQAAMPEDAEGLGALFSKMGIEKVFEAVSVAFGNDYNIAVEPIQEAAAA
jgi:hypothetical protein